MSTILGEVRVFSGNFAPRGWAFCHGQLLDINPDNQQIFAVLGKTYGGDGVKNFALPDLRGRVVIGTGQGRDGLTDRQVGEKVGSATHQLTLEEIPAHTHAVSACMQAAQGASTSAVAKDNALTHDSEGIGSYVTYESEAHLDQLVEGSVSVTVAETGKGEPFSKIRPVLALHYIIALQGDRLPPAKEFKEEWVHDDDGNHPMFGEIRLFAGPYEPAGWAICDGRLINHGGRSLSNFPILGTNFGGDGRSTYALPDLRGRVPICAGTAHGLHSFRNGEKGGLEKEVLHASDLPAHAHAIEATLLAAPGEALADRAANGLALADASKGHASFIDNYNSNKPDVEMAPQSVEIILEKTGAAKPKAFDNMQPSMALNYIICTRGIFPKRS